MKRKVKIPINILFLFGFLIYSSYNLIIYIQGINIEFVKVNYGIVEEKINKEGLVIRDEKICKSHKSGDIFFFFNEGQRVAKDEKIAIIENNLDKSTLRKRDDYKVLDKNILEKYHIDKNNIDNIFVNMAFNIKNKTMQENYDIKDQRDFIDDLLKSSFDMNTTNNKFNNNSYLKSNMAGVISFFSDGLESKYSFENLSSITKEDILNDNKENMLKEANYVKKGEAVCKIVNNHNFYVAFLLTDKEKLFFEKNINIKLKKDNKKFHASYKKEKTIVQNGYNIGFFKVYDEKWNFKRERNTDFDLIFKFHSGIKVPKKTVTRYNGDRGVFTLDEDGLAKFIELKHVLFENEEFLIIDYKKSKMDGKSIKLYDELVVNPLNIKNGQKVR
ncbi:HlyD family efflux transporter periplasmic adaptor subunit [Peptostreptococcaceae bacterium AGR-M142]